MGRKKYATKSKNPTIVRTEKGNYRWTKGNSSLSNPVQTSHREKTKNNWRNKKEIVQKISSSLSGGKTSTADLLKLHGLASNEDLENFEMENGVGLGFWGGEIG